MELPTRLAHSIPDASVQAISASESSETSRGLRGGAVLPRPGRSGAYTLRYLPRRSAVGRKYELDTPKPWISTTGGASDGWTGKATCVCMRHSPTCVQRLSAGRSTPCEILCCLFCVLLFVCFVVCVSCAFAPLFF